MCVFITAVPLIKLFAWGEEESGGHVLRETTSQVRWGLVCPSRTSEQELLGPSYFFISLVLGPLNSLLWYVPS